VAGDGETSPAGQTEKEARPPPDGRPAGDDSHFLCAADWLPMECVPTMPGGHRAHPPAWGGAAKATMPVLATFLTAMNELIMRMVHAGREPTGQRRVNCRIRPPNWGLWHRL